MQAPRPYFKNRTEIRYTLRLGDSVFERQVWRN